MKLIDSNLACPACQQALQPKLLVCPACDIKVEGPFQLNEFATLGPEDLHFLRIFVRSEGRIREMESALGLSYPTIRARLSALKRKLSGEVTDAGGSQDGGSKEEAKLPRSEEESVAAVLAKLNAGEIPFDEAMREIKRIRATGPGKE
jgi:hypothetical protein